MFNSDNKKQELKLCLEKRFFLGEGPGQGPNPRLLGHRSHLDT
jgi:hypothetical protein